MQPRHLFVIGVGWWAGVEMALCAEPSAEVPATAARSARVVITENRQSIVRFEPQLDRVAQLVQCGLTNLTGHSTVTAAWHSLVSTSDTVGIKVFSRPGPTSGTRPVVVEAVIKGLLDAGLRPRQITVWDRNLADLRLAGFFQLAERYGVRVSGAAEAGYDETRFYERPGVGQLVWGDLEFGKREPGVGRRSFASKLLGPELKKIISISPLLNHNQLGVSGHLHSLALGSVDNALRFEGNPVRLSEAIPEIVAKSEIGLADRLVLGITDALIAQYQGEETQLLQYSAVLGQLWFSTDPVALDVLGLQELDRQRRLAGMEESKAGRELFENADLMLVGLSNTNHYEVLRPDCP